MGTYLIFVSLVTFILASSTNAACDRCVHESRAAFFSKSEALQSGACGYANLAVGFNDGRLAAATPEIYHDGAACGTCYQIWCKDSTICSKKGTVVLVTDLNNDNRTGFVLSSRAFLAMANKGKGHDILGLGLADVQYKRVPCGYQNRNLAIRVEESSQKPNYYLAIKFLYQGGQTEILVVEVAKVDTPSWVSMSRNHGAVWDVSRVPTGALQIRFAVIGGYDAKWNYVKNVLPANWTNGVTYDAGFQITDIAQDGCNPCED